MTNDASNTVSVINTFTNKVTATVNVGNYPVGVVVTPNGKKLYVANNGDSTVSVIDTVSNTVTATVSVGNSPRGVAVTPDGKKVYIANTGSSSISVIDTGTNKVIATMSVGNGPIAMGQFIGSVSTPVANFTSNVTSGYVPLTVQFTDLSKNAAGWKWNFGDGTNSTQQNPTHVFKAIGNYTVALTAMNAAGNDTTTKTNYIKVTVAPQLPVAAFSATPTSGTAPLNVNFTDTSTGTPTK